jgi:serine/threonine protein kinase
LNIVNRDVSPSNVRLGYGGEIKLLDFGIAQGMLKLTSEIGVLKGKFSYMSPEQIRGMPVDARTDIFSTAILLHEMLTREKLFRGDSEFELMERVRTAEIPPPSRFNRRVRPTLDQIVTKALAREPAERFQTAAEFADALDEVLATYGFHVQELQDFLRQTFPAEHARETAEVSACFAAVASPEDTLDFQPVTLRYQGRRWNRTKSRAAEAEASPPLAANRFLTWVLLVAAITIAAAAVILLLLR